MVKINNISGKKMQISFSKQHIYQDYKQDIESSISVGMQTQNIVDCARYIATGTDADIEKVELYSLIYGLGRTEYGTKGLQYINDKLPEDINKIEEKEIARYNLGKIFQNYDTDIGDEVFQEFSRVYKDEMPNDPLEIKVVRFAIILEKIAEGVKESFIANGIKDELAGIKLKLEEIRKMKLAYNKTQKLELTSKLKELLDKINKLYQQYQLSESQEIELDEYIEQNINNSLPRGEILDKLYNFKSNISKKKERR